MKKNDVNPNQDSLDRGVYYGFIPRPLAIPNCPGLDIFPYNVMFAQYKNENGKTIMGSAIYDPVINSYKKEGAKCSMEYFGVYGPGSRLLIEYDEVKKSYWGEKFVNDISVGQACGIEWKMFFVHFTMLGLFTGERCKFDETVPGSKTS